jgi:hypothetical protein
MNEQEFLDFWKTIEWPVPKPIFYRLYHDDDGIPLFYSQDDLPGKYIDLTPAQFSSQDMSVRVVNEKLVRRRTAWVSKLVPAESGTLCHSQDITVVVADQPGQYWKKEDNVIETN